MTEISEAQLDSMLRRNFLAPSYFIPSLHLNLQVHVGESFLMPQILHHALYDLKVVVFFFVLNFIAYWSFFVFDDAERT